MRWPQQFERGERWLSVAPHLVQIEGSVSEASKIARAVQAVSAGLGCVVGAGALLYILALHGVCGGSRPPPQRRMYRILLAHVVFKIVSDIPFIIFSFVDVPISSWEYCSYVAPVSPAFFVLSCAATNLIYLERAKAAAMLTEQSRFARALWRICLVAVHHVPLLLLMMWLTIRGEIYHNSVCVLQYGWRESTFFVVTDASLSTAFLYLFFEPVRKHLNAIRENSMLQTANATLIYRLVVRNLVWASIAVFSTTAFMIFTSIIADGSMASGSFFLKLLLGTAMPLTSTVNMICTLAITQRIWERKKVGARVRITTCVAPSTRKTPTM